MNILIAPDSLKGSLSAIEFCQIVERQINEILPKTNIYSMPLADGGEGTIDAILASVKGKKILVNVNNALHEPIQAEYAILDDKNTAIIEIAQASGLPQIHTSRRNPMLASSYGTGELINHALAQGCQRLIIGLGGSATNDGGMGMLQALGVQFFDANNNIINACGQNLKKIESIELSDLNPQLQHCEIIIASDVTNPLLGDMGATYVFGPQKGAVSSDLSFLEAGMANFAAKSIDILNIDKSLITIAGVGAAGGMGFALMAYCKAFMKSGFELIANMANLEQLFSSPKTRPNFIITGEGQFDRQSLQGKLVGQLIKRTKQYQIPLLIICGSISHEVVMRDLGDNVSVFSLCNGPITLEYAMNNTPTLLESLMSNLAKTILLSQKDDEINTKEA